MATENNVLRIADFIGHNEAFSDEFMRTQNSVRNRLAKGERFAPFEMLALPEFFALRIKVNRMAIDVLGIYPTRDELDSALEMNAEMMLENIVAFEDISNPSFNC